MKTWVNIALIFLIFSCGTKKHAETAKEFSVNDYPYIEKFHQGLRFKMRGQFPQAIEAFEVCKLMKPQDDAVYFALAQVYLQNQQLSKSAEAIQVAVKLDPKNKWYLQEYAYMLYDTKNFKEASKQFKTLSELDPSNVEWLFSYAESLMRSNDIAGAIKALDKLEKEIGINPELSIQKFTMYRQLKQDEKAVNEIQKCLVDFPSDAQLLANLVDYYFETKQDEKAFTYLIKLAENDPANGNAHLALAQYYDQKGNHPKSYEELKKAFVCDDVKLDTKSKILLGMFESQTKLDPEMLVLATLLVDKYPNDARVYTIRGDFYLKEGKDDLALKDFQQALEFDKTKFAIWEQVLIMEYQNQDYKRLYIDSKTCLDYFPTIPKVFLFFGISANQEKKYAEALEKLNAGEELVVNDPSLKSEMLSQKGDALFALKKVNEGKEAYESALKLDAENILLKNNYAYRLALANTDLDKAESLIKQVLEKSPNESHFIDTYGWILFQKGKYNEALEQFKKALVQKPEDKHLIEHLGDALFKTGNVNDALVAWKKAKELGSTNLKLNEKIEKKAYYEPVY